MSGAAAEVDKLSILKACEVASKDLEGFEVDGVVARKLHRQIGDLRRTAFGAVKTCVQTSFARSPVERMY